ncbi:MAG: thiopeptide-type bacteriocin biosynthesis protein [Dysgonamonadaceae bacterium]|jgi:thiopeptide-type bacteriocin biosynthesis protein|nr:thiopeptide-type bacteriocin biosynthesis protein [Dysgonamonadaceae bacterium]
MENIRTFMPGSEWLYFKIYTGAKTADRILKDSLYPFVTKLLGDRIIDRWFYIRYADPDFHVRFRLHLTETRNFNSVFNGFYDTFHNLIENDLAWNIQCDTYQRELERYGMNTIDLVEYIFYIDSELSINLLEHLDADNTEEHRWLISLMLIDSYFSVFSFDMDLRKELMNQMAEGYKNEFGIKHHNMKQQLDTKYRTYKETIWSVMDNGNVSDSIYGRYHELIQKYRQVIFSTVQEILRIEKEGKSQVKSDALLTGIIHMTMNRWFRSKNRLHELLIYDFMSRYYNSRVAKEKYATKNENETVSTLYSV